MNGEVHPTVTIPQMHYRYTLNSNLVNGLAERQWATPTKDDIKQQEVCHHERQREIE